MAGKRGELLCRTYARGCSRSQPRGARSVVFHASQETHMLPSAHRLTPNLTRSEATLKDLSMSSLEQVFVICLRKLPTRHPHPGSIH